jgi:hypothetical protein
VLFCDLTSTCFESSQPDNENHERCYVISRDRRNDCTQVLIALIVTPDGYPLRTNLSAEDSAKLWKFLWPACSGPRLSSPCQQSRGCWDKPNDDRFM